MARCGDRQCGKGAVLTILRVTETGSTNADMLVLASRGEAREGDWLVAERQTAGRGRQGRAWVSQSGNLHGSTIIRLRPDDPPASTLSLAVGIGVVIAIGDPAYLKWPNDLLIRDAKVAGILLERQNDAVIVGIGINLAFAPAIEDRRTTYLDVDGLFVRTVDEMLEALVEWVPWAVSMWREHGVEWVVRRWGEEAHPVGTSLDAALPDGSRIQGLFHGLTHDGALRLKLPDGRVRVIHAGDVFLI